MLDKSAVYRTANRGEFCRIPRNSERLFVNSIGACVQFARKAGRRSGIMIAALDKPGQQRRRGLAWTRKQGQLPAQEILLFRIHLEIQLRFGVVPASRRLRQIAKHVG